MKKVCFLPDVSQANPYQSKLASSVVPRGFEVSYISGKTVDLLKIALKGKHSIVHLHWPDTYILNKSKFKSFYKTVATLFAFYLLHIRGVKLILTLHNLKNHESLHPEFESIFYNWFLPLTHRIIAHCCFAKEEFVRIHGEKYRKRTVVIPHGNYVGVYGEEQSSISAKQRLGLDSEKRVLLSLGNIRPYKGILKLVDTFQALDLPNVQLLIAGNSRNKSDFDLIQSRIKSQNVIFQPGFVADEEITTYFSAADAFVVPFEDILTSGSIILAMSFGLPCIAPRIGCLPETLQHQPELLYDAKDENGLAHSIELAFHRFEQFSNEGRLNFEYAKNELAWEKIGRLTADAYEDE